MASAALAFALVLLLLSPPVVQGQYDWDVTYSSTEVCALEGSTVEIRCTYKYPFPQYYTVEDTFWFTWVEGYQYVELRKASVFAGRLQDSCDETNCTLRITDVRQSDSGVYYFRFITNQYGGIFTGEPGVTVSVKDLQIKVPNSNKLQCFSSCRLPDHSSFIWYKNGHKISGNQKEIYEYNSEADSYSCALSGREDFPSASVCFSGQTCNKVVYTDRSICAVKGSSVDISCTYNSHSGSITSKLWFRSDRSRQTPSQPQDLCTDVQFTGRVQVLEAATGGSTLRISDVTETDSGQYGFTFTAGGFEWGSSLSGTTLTVTDPDLQVVVLRYSTKLQCFSSCRLPDHSSFIWYKNGNKISGSQKEIYGSNSEADSYSCALSGREDFPSASVCVRGETCNKVIYTDRSICAVKGSSVDISCIYNSYSGSITSKLWFRSDRSRQSPSQPQDLRTDVQFTGRVQVLEAETGGSTLRISDVTEMDSGQYGFTFTRYWFEWGSSLSGATLTVTVLQVQVITSSVQDSHTDAELRCLSSCSSAARLSYVWFKNGHKVTTEDEFYRGRVDPGDAIVCALKGQENFKSASVYAPDVPSVSVVPTGNILKNSSVTLNCSSDANPAANYTWYQRDSHPESIHEGPQLVFSSIQSSDSGQFYCVAENQLGRRRSEFVSFNVEYAPDVPSVSVVPSDQIVEDSSVTLTCSSDANPAANYTWYKEDEEAPKASGQNFTITDVRAEDGGKYSCEAWNSRGRRNSTVHLTLAVGTLNPAVTGVVSAVVLVLILLCVVVLMRKRRFSKPSSEPGETGRVSEQRVLAQGEEEQDGLQYASVWFCRNQADPVYSNFTPAELNRNQEHVEYATVSRENTGPRVQGHGEEDVTALYSTVVKAN